MSEEVKEVHIKTYDEWLKYYKNATKEQVIEDLTRDVNYFADAVEDIKDLQNKLQQKDKELEARKQLINKQDKELWTLEHIIKEIRKAINDESNRYYDDDGNFSIIDGDYLKQILDKGE